MGACVAKIVKQRYYQAWRDYVLFCVQNNKSSSLLGQYVSTNYEKHTIINMFTQYKVGQGKQVSYDAIDQCFNKLNTSKRYNAVAIPKIGAGLAGGNCNIIETVINENTPDTEIVVYVL